MLVALSVSGTWGLFKKTDEKPRSHRTMSSPEKLTGRWIGHYEQRGKEYPISADLLQKGENLTGSMRDGQPDSDRSLFDATVEAGLPPGADEQIDADLRALFPETPSTPIRSLSQLPP